MDYTDNPGDIYTPLSFTCCLLHLFKQLWSTLSREYQHEDALLPCWKVAFRFNQSPECTHSSAQTLRRHYKQKVIKRLQICIAHVYIITRFINII